MSFRGGRGRSGGTGFSPVQHPQELKPSEARAIAPIERNLRSFMRVGLLNYVFEKMPGLADEPPTPDKTFKKASRSYLAGTSIGAGAGGASSGALPQQEEREKPARAPMRPSTVTSFIVFLSVGFGL